MKLRKSLLLVIATAFLSAGMLSSCFDDGDDDAYQEWKEENDAWLAEQIALVGEDGNLVYTASHPNYSPSATIYFRYCEDPTENEGNLQPLFTSTCKVNYALYLYDGTMVDSAANYEFAMNSSGLIAGWSMAIENMHVGDSIEALLPYNVGYGSTGSGSVLPYSVLRFNLRLVDIPYYEVRPEE